jgi:IS605 OrfB family transposase
MRRACPVTLKYLTAKKQRQLAALLQAYRAAVNFYLRSLWQMPGKLDKATLARLHRTRLSERYKSQALKQALEMVVATRKSAKILKKYVACPVFTGAAILDAKFVTIEPGQKSFDLILKLSCLRKGVRLIIPTRKTRVLNKWLAMSSATFIQGCALTETRCILWVNIPDPELVPITATSSILAVDLGLNKLLTDSNGHMYGTEFRQIRNKIRRRQPGSTRRQQAHRERDNYIRRIVNQLFTLPFHVLGVEALLDLKRGKTPKRGKAFRKALAPWTYRHVLTRMEQKAQENRVHLVAVPPAYTSQTCPLCNTVSKNNRKGETFRCTRCGYTADADDVGAQNILVRTLRAIGRVESPMATKDRHDHS